MSRCRNVVVVAVLLSMTGMLRADKDLPNTESSHAASSYPETWPAEMQSVPGGEWSDELHKVPASAPDQYPYDMAEDTAIEADTPWPFLWPKPKWVGLRHSTTHGRHVGRGSPLTGTSWLNRPYYVGGHIGPMWMTRSIDENVSTDIDTFGGIFLGWDTDYFWGNELHFDWSTPELKHSDAPDDAQQTGSTFTWSYNFFYYPWGDARFRPYWRAGLGSSHFEIPLEDGSRDDEWMWTVPLGIGVKYPIRRWLAARAELTDYMSLDNDHPEQHNVALVFGLEWRFGAHPPSYWPWNPSRHIW